MQGGEQDSFQDAVDNADGPADTVDTSSVRSLTKRSVSVAKSPSSQPERDEKGKELSPAKVTKEDNQNFETEVETVEYPKPESGPESRPNSLSHSKRISNTSNLDNVNLDDENPTKTHGMQMVTFWENNLM